ncbi:hypothetical protein QBL02_11590 [Leucobacter sp. UT-8R-CII-1-4]|uniref:hypothetical protein n=1 Tax=Leucobacter sp. UT-8R-CII-1-4 TaxID=3040075 RepID=UPI0024A7B170|nr:hypothetical protein [Leucobacter sp. UT-8R-CII-1-4]MDI6024185.1 hypothetical protein [Leucobacter sp. UT-8R-CII-1-4]
MSYLPPRYDLIPRSVQNAMILRGDLIRCGPGVRGIAWPDNSLVRLTALAPYLAGDRIASHLTAAWVWLAVQELVEPLQVATSPRRGHARRILDSRIAQLTLAEKDTKKLGYFLITTPEHTVFDLLHSTEPDSPILSEAIRQLLAGLPDCGAALKAQIMLEKRPYARLARQRFAANSEPTTAALV